MYSMLIRQTVDELDRFVIVAEISAGPDTEMFSLYPIVAPMFVGSELF